MSYRLTSTSTIIRLSDNAAIPADPGNIDYREYQAWLTRGNTPQPAPSAEASPLYAVLLDLILASDLYQLVVTQSIANPAVNTALTVTMGAIILAVNGRPNLDALRAGFQMLLGAMTLTPANLAELNSILTQANLTQLLQ
jgi:hypothetical protein